MNDAAKGAITKNNREAAKASRSSTLAPTVGDYFSLLKPRVMSLVVFTAWVGVMAAPQSMPHPFLAALSILCIAVGAGASGALNMWYDADIDALMKRTSRRPIPAGRVEPAEALAFGLFLSGAAVLVMSLAANWLAAGLLTFTIFFYAVIYTIWLKRWTTQNIVIGGAAGALPPVIGWAAVTGTVTLESLALFLIIFLWTPPHFWALSLLTKDEYARASIPMLPVIKGKDETKRQILIYTLILVVFSALPLLLGMAGLLYAATAVILGSLFITMSFQLWRQGKGAATLSDAEALSAKRLFFFSILYLFLLFLAFPLERILKLPAFNGNILW